jgi:hypothetical protein
LLFLFFCTFVINRCLLYWALQPYTQLAATRHTDNAARKPDTQPSAPHHTDKAALKPDTQPSAEDQAPNTTGSNHLYNTLELLMMGIMVPRNMLSKQ